MRCKEEMLRRVCAMADSLDYEGLKKQVMPAVRGLCLTTTSGEREGMGMGNGAWNCAVFPFMLGGRVHGEHAVSPHQVKKTPAPSTPPPLNTDTHAHALALALALALAFALTSPLCSGHTRGCL